jgi:hypothetical protein
MMKVDQWNANEKKYQALIPTSRRANLESWICFGIEITGKKKHIK